MLNISCPHQDAENARRVCLHLLEEKDPAYLKWFTGLKLDYDLLCSACAQNLHEAEPNLSLLCLECFDELQEEGYWEGIVGRPQILERPSDLYFAQQTIKIPELPTTDIADIQPVNNSEDSVWVALTTTGKLFTVNLSKPSVSFITELSDSGLNLDSFVALYISDDGLMAAIVNTFGQHGIVLDLRAKKLTMALKRDNYRIDVTSFPVAFFSLDGRLLLIHGTAWNRLDVSDPQTGALLTDRDLTSYQQGQKRPDHYLDYFHGRLSVSPDQEWVSDNGWVWAPAGIVATWNLRRWIYENLWESEDGPSRMKLCGRHYYWDGPLCWIDPNTLAVWGYGEDDEWLIPAVRLFDVRSGKETRWFAGPEIESKEKKKWLHNPFDSLVFDKYLFSFSEKHGTSVWDVVSGERLLQNVTLSPKGYHRGAKQFLSLLPDGTFQIAHLLNR